MQGKDFDDSLPDGMAVEFLFHWYAFPVSRFNAVKDTDYVLQVLYMIHAVASTKSPTLQNVLATPAAIAGVQRIVLCRLTKL